MRIHILGICGTFMGGIARLACELGHEVVGYDKNAYPPMSTQLEKLGIEILPLSLDKLHGEVDIVVVGNALSRGHSLVEYVLNNNIPYVSGPQWLKENILQNRWVLAVTGTHGKTTTSSMLAWILECCNYKPGFLIGGVPSNFNCSASLGESKYFVIEGDEYDTAFFDKRSKFVHYIPKTLILNNLEFDHADIFNNLDEIKKQFHHLLRIIPSDGEVIVNNQEKNLFDVLDKGCWSKISYFNKTDEKKLQGNNSWYAEPINNECSNFKVYFGEELKAEVNWQLLGEHNMSNAIAAIAAADSIGISPENSAKALKTFTNVARRLELKYKINNVSVYDDFAHHPSAIVKTIKALKSKVGENVIPLVDLSSNTMCNGTHKGTLIQILNDSNFAIILTNKKVTWDVQKSIDLYSKGNVFLANSPGEVVEAINSKLDVYNSILVMSNQSTVALHNSLKDMLEAKATVET